MKPQNVAIARGHGYPMLTPRQDRLLLHWYPENVRDLQSNRAFLRLPLEAKGVLGALRHLFLHGGLLPNDPQELAWAAREPDTKAFEKWIPVILQSGMFAATPDGAYIYDLALDAEIADASAKVKALKQGGAKGGKNKGKSEGGGPEPTPESVAAEPAREIPF